MSTHAYVVGRAVNRLQDVGHMLKFQPSAAVEWWLLAFRVLGAEAGAISGPRSWKHHSYSLPAVASGLEPDSIQLCRAVFCQIP